MNDEKTKMMMGTCQCVAWLGYSQSEKRPSDGQHPTCGQPARPQASAQSSETEVKEEYGNSLAGAWGAMVKK